MAIGKPFLLLAFLAPALLAMGSSPQSQWKALPMVLPKGIQSAAAQGERLPNELLHLAVAIPCRDTAGLQAFVDSVSDPSSPNYRQFIGPEDVGQRFGIDAASLQKVSDYLTSNGFSIKLVAKNRLSILADATVAQAEAAFHTTIQDYVEIDAAPGADSLRYSFTTPPSVPASISPYINYVEGLDDFNRPTPAFTLTPGELRTLYNISASYGSGFKGQGRTIGISSFTTYGLQNIPLEYAMFNLPTPSVGVGKNIKVVSIDDSNGEVTSGAAGEADADMQCVLAMAPLCNLIIYDDANKGGAGYLATLTKEADDNLADIITESYGRSGETTAFWASIHTLHLSMSAAGITYMCAAGDTGTQWPITFPYPDVEPEVLTVGGTTVAIDGDGNRTSEIVWDNTSTGAAGGGGWAPTKDAFNVLPSYQKGAGVPTNIPYRLLPDISLDSDSRSGYELFRNGVYLPSENIFVGGTSCASPTFAGILADSEQQIIAGGGLPANGLGYHRFGRIQDLLYSFNGDPSVFFDVVSGTNGALPNGATSNAGPGWDTASGWGAIIASGFINRVLGLPSILQLSIYPTSVAGGSTATGSVDLTAAAPHGGLAVTLSTQAAGVTVPGSVTVAAGVTSATFNIATSPVTAPTSATILAMQGGGTFSSVLTIVPSALSTVSFSPSSVVGGSSSTGTVTLSGPAPTGGLTAKLASSSTVVRVPASVTITSGSTSATFTATTTVVSANTSSSISATLGSSTASATLTVTAATLSSLTVAPTSVTGGGSAVGTVTLTGNAGSSGLAINISSNSSNATVPAVVTVAVGTSSATFTITTSVVSTNVVATISATVGSLVKTATLTIDAASLSAVSVSPSTVTGGLSSQGTVTLSSAAGTGGFSVALSSSGTTASVPANVTVTAGGTSGGFTITTTAVATSTNVTIKATASTITKTTTLTITPPQVKSVSIAPSTVAGGASAVGTASLTGPAPTGGISLALTSSSTSASVPAKVTVAAGATAATFTIATSTVSSAVSATITASLGVSNAAATLTISPVALVSLILNPTTVAGGNSSTGTVALNGSAGSGGVVVTLTSANKTAVTIPSSVTVLSGQTSATFSIKTVAVATSVSAPITATLKTVTKSATLVVQPATVLSVSLNPATVTGLTSSTGTVTLTGAAATGGLVVTLSSNSIAASVPASVTVAAGKTTATFTVKTVSVATQTVAAISAAQSGKSVSATLTINPPSITSLILSPASVVGGKSSAATLTLSTAAPAGGVTVKLASGSSSATVPASVVVAAGKTSATFVVTTKAVSTQTVAAITATLGSTSKSANLTITK